MEWIPVRFQNGSGHFLHPNIERILLVYTTTLPNLQWILYASQEQVDTPTLSNAPDCEARVDNPTLSK